MIKLLPKGIRKNQRVYEGRLTYRGKRYQVASKDLETCIAKFELLKQRLFAGNDVPGDCEIRQAQTIAEMPLSELLPVLRSKTFTLGSWLAVYIERFIRKKGVTDAYVHNQYTFAKHLRPLWDIKLTDLTGIELHDQISLLAVKGRTQEYVYDLVCRALKKAQQLRILEYNPADVIEIRIQPKKRRKPLTVSEQIKLVRYVMSLSDSEAYKDVVLFAIWTGLRPSELRRVRKRHFDFQRGLFDVVGTKTENAPRVGIIPPYFAKKFVVAKNDYFFRHDYGKVNDQLASWCVAAGIRKYTLYNLRHTFSTRLYENKTPDLIIEKLMGHSTIDFTKEHYIAVLTDFLTQNVPTMQPHYLLGVDDTFSAAYEQSARTSPLPAQTKKTVD